MLYTWTRAAAALQRTDQVYKDWQSLCRQLELDNKGLPARLEAFDQVLDTAEETVDRLSS